MNVKEIDTLDRLARRVCEGTPGFRYIDTSISSVRDASAIFRWHNGEKVCLFEVTRYETASFPVFTVADALISALLASAPPAAPRDEDVLV